MRYLTLFALFAFAINAFGQESIDNTKSDNVILIVENPPTFPGGFEKLYKFLGGKMKYPKEARKSGIQGRVVVGFVVEKDGSVNAESVKIEQSAHPLLDEEAIRVVKLMPRWTPGNHKGRNVRVMTRIPITFTLG